MNGTITLRAMRFTAHHGVGEQERKVGNQFEVTLSVTCPMQGALVDDNLDGTINYAELYEQVAAVMSEPSRLLEHVAWRIAQSVRSRFPQITSCTVTVTKIAPPFKCDLAGASVTFSF